MKSCIQLTALVRGRDLKSAWGTIMVSAMVVLFLFYVLPSSVRGGVQRRTPVVEAVEKALPSVVNIGTERLVKIRYSDPERRFRGDLFDRFFADFFSLPPLPGYRVGHSLGSGVIVHRDGYILTNYHVIERASRILVTLSDESAYAAKMVAGDEISDLALIKVDTEEPLKAVTFAENDDLLLGETVIVLGNPFGLSHTVTVGVLSAMNRRATYEGEVLYRDILQTDAAVNPGSSGGPMLNVEGALIGVNVAIYQDAQNIGFAIPVKRVRSLLTEWMSPRYVKENWLGIDFAEAEDDTVRIEKIFDKGPAADTPLQAGDRVVAVDGKEIETLLEFNAGILSKRRGETVTVTVMRDGEAKATEIALQMEAVPKPSGRALGEQRLGLSFNEETKETAARSGSYHKGLPIERVSDGGPGSRLGLQPGFWITRINEYEIRTLDDVGMALEDVQSGDLVAMVVVSFDERESFIVAQSTLVQVKAD